MIGNLRRKLLFSQKSAELLTQNCTVMNWRVALRFVSRSIAISRCIIVLTKIVVKRVALRGFHPVIGDHSRDLLDTNAHAGLQFSAR